MGNTRTSNVEDGRVALAKMKLLRSQYAAAGGRMDNTIFIALVTIAMPKTLSVPISALFMSATVTNIIDDASVVNFLTKLEELLRTNAILNDEATPTAMAAHDTRDADMKCHNCDCKGHRKADCWAKGGGKEGQGPNQGSGSKRGKGKGRGRPPDPKANVASTITNADA